MGEASACFLRCASIGRQLLTFECVEDSLLEILVVGNSSFQEGLQGKQGYKWYPSCLDS